MKKYLVVLLFLVGSLRGDLRLIISDDTKVTISDDIRQHSSVLQCLEMIKQSSRNEPIFIVPEITPEYLKTLHDIATALEIKDHQTKINKLKKLFKNINKGMTQLLWVLYLLGFDELLKLIQKEFPNYVVQITQISSLIKNLEDAKKAPENEELGKAIELPNRLMYFLDEPAARYLLLPVSFLYSFNSIQQALLNSRNKGSIGFKGDFLSGGAIAQPHFNELLKQINPVLEQTSFGMNCEGVENPFPFLLPKKIFFRPNLRKIAFQVGGAAAVVALVYALSPLGRDKAWCIALRNSLAGFLKTGGSMFLESMRYIFNWVNRMREMRRAQALHVK